MRTPHKNPRILKSEDSPPSNPRILKILGFDATVRFERQRILERTPLYHDLTPLKNLRYGYRFSPHSCLFNISDTTSLFALL